MSKYKQKQKQIQESVEKVGWLFEQSWRMTGGESEHYSITKYDIKSKTQLCCTEWLSDSINGALTQKSIFDLLWDEYEKLGKWLVVIGGGYTLLYGIAHLEKNEQGIYLVVKEIWFGAEKSELRVYLGNTYQEAIHTLVVIRTKLKEVTCKKCPFYEV